MDKYLSYLQEKLFSNYQTDKTYDLLYQDINIKTLKDYFIQTHQELNRHFNWMNNRLSVGRYLADDSRDLISLLDTLESVQVNFKGTIYAFEITEQYLEIINKCKSFLSMTYGSDFPEDFNRIHLIEIQPIFNLVNSTQIERFNTTDNLKLRLLGKGSYAKVYEYLDPYYDTKFVKKIANKDLTDKEIKRFQIEFEEMKKINSPYVIEVYSYDEDDNSYIMEYADITVDKFISKKNNQITLSTRLNLINQIFKAFNYLTTRGILHRDISINNVLLKFYDDIIVVKISDFGLVKLQNSNLTSKNTDFKGSFNDPQLLVDGFSNYSIKHEIYALTRLIYFVLTGKTNMENIKNKKLEEFIHRGVNPQQSLRYSSINEMKQNFDNMVKFL